MNDIFSLMAQFKNNPMALLTQRFNIPSNINNPQEIVQYLLNTGQISQNQLNQVMQMKNNPMLKNLWS